MKQIKLNSNWKIRWSDGQRGGMPHFLHYTDEQPNADIAGAEKFIREKDYDEKKWLDAVVPGEVHLDLMRHGIINSPYEGTGALECRWVEECFWFYRTVFDAPEASQATFQRLVFEGLDYGAVIYLNGKEIARHENAFYPCEIDVSGMLCATGNILLVRLESGLYSVCERPIRDYFTATNSVDAMLHKRNWLRKTQSQTEWDWSPRLLNVGIFKPVILKYSDSIIVDSSSVSCSVNDSLTEGKAKVRVFASHYKEDLKNLTLSVTLADENFVFRFDSVPENGIFETDVTILNPILWWPVGYGNPHLYELKITLNSDSKILYSETKKVGFRHVQVNQNLHETEGNYFVFEINKAPVFMRGANLVPNDLINAAMTASRYSKMIDRALEANFNFLRIWGGGLYENDILFSLCNEKGIMLWQEFVAACAVIPINDEGLLDSIKKEAVYNIRRLSCHPSLIAWCGNNEIGWATNHMDTLHAKEDYPLYHSILPELLKKEDGEKYYQPTSPYSKLLEDQNSEISGDQHPWHIGFCNKDSRNYEKSVARFPNEGGILGSVSLKATKACLRPGEEYPHSFSWQVHDNMLESWMPGSSPDDDVRFWLNKEITEMTLEETVYSSGLVQAEGLKRYIENYRRRKYSTSAAVFWMFNDIWPATRSWTIIDYYFGKNPSFYQVSRAFSPVAPVIAKENGSFVIYGVNDTLNSFAGVIHYGIFAADGTYLSDEKTAVELTANASIVLAEIPASHADEYSQGNTFVFCVLCDEKGNLIGRTRYNDNLFSELNLPDAAITIERIADGYLFLSKCFVMNICLDLDGDKDISDNFFDLYPNQPYFVKTKDIKEKDPILFSLNSFLNTNSILSNTEKKEPLEAS